MYDLTQSKFTIQYLLNNPLIKENITFLKLLDTYAKTNQKVLQ